MGDSLKSSSLLEKELGLEVGLLTWMQSTLLPAPKPQPPDKHPNQHRQARYVGLITV